MVVLGGSTPFISVYLETKLPQCRCCFGFVFYSLPCLPACKGLACLISHVHVYSHLHHSRVDKDDLPALEHVMQKKTGKCCRVKGGSSCALTGAGAGWCGGWCDDFMPLSLCFAPAHAWPALPVGWRAGLSGLGLSQCAGVFSPEGD